MAMRDAPTTLREFETIFILRPDTNMEGIHTLTARAKATIEQLGGPIKNPANRGNHIPLIPS